MRQLWRHFEVYTDYVKVDPGVHSHVEIWTFYVPSVYGGLREGGFFYVLVDLGS